MSDSLDQLEFRQEQKEPLFHFLPPDSPYWMEVNFQGRRIGFTWKDFEKVKRWLDEQPEVQK